MTAAGADSPVLTFKAAFQGCFQGLWSRAADFQGFVRADLGLPISAEKERFVALEKK